ncbi:MAG: TlpA family protein disulfide reductase [Bacteroidia bacterium]|nr:TlpA family protein disulfide reductase [Bacteroidia bacterium]
MRIFFLYLSLITGFSSAWAQKTTLVGKADAVYFGKEIRLVGYDDNLSDREVVLARDTVRPPGFFTFVLQMKYTRPLFIRCGNKQAVIYAEPGKTYKLGLLKADSSIIETVGGLIPVNLVFMNSDSAELNYLISRCDERLNELLKSEKGTAVKDQRPNDLKPDSMERKKNQNYRLLKKIDSLENVLRAELKYAKQDYFHTYRMYTFAKAKLPLMSGQAAWKEFLKGRPILYEHREYMEFICAFYESELEHKLYTHPVIGVVNANEDCLKFRDLVKHSVYTPNDTLKELSALVLLRLAQSIKQYNKDRLCRTISRAAAEYKHPYHMVMAGNLSFVYCRMIPGSDLPLMHFRDIQGNERTLKEFGDRYIYVMFWRSDISVCEEHMRQIPELKRKYGQKIAFVAVWLDEDAGTVKALMKKYPKADWETFFPSPGGEVQELFNVRGVPIYFLINPFHRLSLSPAPEPGLEIEKKFDEVKKKGNKAFLPGQKEN